MIYGDRIMGVVSSSPLKTMDTEIVRHCANGWGSCSSASPRFPVFREEGTYVRRNSEEREDLR